MHLFILAANNMHSYPFLHYLTDICGVQRNLIKILFFDINSEKEVPLDYQHQGFDIYYSEDWQNPSIYQDVKSITISSLSSVKGKSTYIKRIFDSGLAEYSQLIIRITDDEVDRWSSLFKKHGKIVESKEAYVDKSTVDILQHASRFICLYRPWGQQLEAILGRKLVIYNTSILVNPFTDSNTASLYEGQLRASIRKQVRARDTIRILIHTKPTPTHIIIKILKKALLPLILYNNDVIRPKSLEVALWWPNSIKHITSLNMTLGLLLLAAKLRKIKIRFTLINNMPTETYYSFLSSAHILIAQDRGGLGAIIEASKNGSIIVMKKDSYNEAVYSGYQELPFVKYSKLESALIKPVKLLKENDFESLLDEQEIIATDFFNKQFLQSKKDLLNIYN